MPSHQTIAGHLLALALVTGSCNPRPPDPRDVAFGERAAAAKSEGIAQSRGQELDRGATYLKAILNQSAPSDSYPAMIEWLTNNPIPMLANRPLLARVLTADKPDPELFGLHLVAALRAPGDSVNVAGSAFKEEVLVVLKRSLARVRNSASISDRLDGAASALAKAPGSEVLCLGFESLSPVAARRLEHQRNETAVLLARNLIASFPSDPQYQERVDKVLKSLP